jgi:hypothetical protein
MVKTHAAMSPDIVIIDLQRHTEYKICKYNIIRDIVIILTCKCRIIVKMQHNP